MSKLTVKDGKLETCTPAQVEKYENKIRHGYLTGNGNKQRTIWLAPVRYPGHNLDVLFKYVHKFTGLVLGISRRRVVK